MFFEYEYKLMTMKIDYKIEEVKPNVFAVIVPNHYDRAMMFLRVQEFYESPNEDFRDKHFNIWDYIEWYSREHDDTFTYASDWSGFNIPLKTAWECYEGKDKAPKKGYNGVRSLPDNWKSKWDDIMKDIIWNIDSKMFYKKNKRDDNAYIIGAGNTEGDTFKHEICHGLYATNKQYKDLVDEITISIPIKEYLTFRNNLTKMGYTDKVMNDEIQAYLAFGHDYKPFRNGVNKKVCNALHKQYINIFNNF